MSCLSPPFLSTTLCSLFSHLGSPEITQLHHAPVVDEDISALDIAVDHALAVKVHEPLKDLLGVAGYPAVGERPEVDQKRRHGSRHPFLKDRDSFLVVVDLVLIRFDRQERRNGGYAYTG